MAASKLHRCLKLCLSGLSQQCALGRHLKESRGGEAELQLASRSLLQGISHLVEQGEECITEGQTSRVHSRRRLQAAVCRRQVFFCTMLSNKVLWQHYQIFTKGRLEYNPSTILNWLMDPCFGPLSVCLLHSLLLQCTKFRPNRSTNFSLQRKHSFLNFFPTTTFPFSSAPLVFP